MKKNYACFLIILLLVSGCGKPKKESTEEEIFVPALPSVELPSLTQKQISDGWQILFDGESTKGWRTYQNQPNNSWEVVNGILHCKPFDQAEKRADLITEKQYENFELLFEWKIAFQGNSGVMYRVVEDFEEPYLSGPEFQLMDDENYPGDTKDYHLSGGTFGMYAPTNQVLHPVGEWNTAKLRVSGDSITHWLNGGKTAEYVIGSADWKKRVDAGNWKKAPGFGISKKGHIDLQDHDQEVWFKNIMIREL